MGALTPLFDGDGTVAEIKADVAAIGTIVDLIEKTRVAKPQGFKDAIALLSALDDKTKEQKVKDAFAELGLATEYEAVAGLIAKARALGEKIPDWVKTLLSGIDEFGEKDPGELKWQPVKGEKKLPLGGGFSLGLEGGIALGCAASVTWKPAGDARLMKVVAHGDVSADAKGEVPFSLGKLKAGVNAGVALDLAYYFDTRGSKLPYVAELATRIVQVPAPFDYDAIWEAATRHEGFKGLDYVFAANAGANFDLSLGYLVDQGDALKFNLDATVGLGVTYSRGFKLAVTAVELAGKKALHIKLNRTRLSAVTIGASINVGIDLPRVRAKVQDIVKTKLEMWDQYHEQVEKILSPGTYLRGELQGAARDALDRLVGDDKLREAIQAHLDTVLTGKEHEGATVIGWLQDAVRGAIDRHSAKLIAVGTGQVETVTAEVLDDLGPYLPEQVSEAAKAEIAKLVALAKEELEAGNKALWERLGKETGNAEKALKALLKNAGAKVDGGFGDADDALKGVRELLKKYNAAIQDIAAKAKAAAEKKVSLAVTFSNKRTRALTLNIEGHFTDPGNGGDLFRLLTEGRLDAIRERWGGIIADPDDGFEFAGDLKESSFVELDKFEQEAGVELVLFGFGGKFSEKITAEAKSTLDAAGNVQIDGEASLKKRFSSGSVEREASFSDSLTFVAAKQVASGDAPVSRTFKLGVDIGYQDAGYAVEELNGFLAALEPGKLALISAEDAAEARKTFKTFLDDGAKEVNASVNAALWIGTGDSGGRLEKVLLLGDAHRNPDGSLKREARRALFDIAIKAAAQTGAERSVQDVENAIDDVLFDESFKGRSVANLPDDPASKLMVLGAPVEEADGKRWIEVIRREAETGPNGRMSPKEAIVYRNFYRGEGLAQIIRHAGLVYRSSPVGQGAWTRDRYLDEQRKIVEGSGKWLSLNAGKDGIARITLAFLVALRALTGGDPSDPVQLKLTDRRDPEKPKDILI